MFIVPCFPYCPAPEERQCFGWFANAPYISLLTERGLIRAARAINISLLLWSENGIHLLHLKLEFTKIE